MKGKKLFRNTGVVDDDVIGETDDNKQTQKAINKKLIILAVVAVFALILSGSGIWYLKNHDALLLKPGHGGSGHTEGSSFMHYAGPVLPLNAVGDTVGITASRNTHFAFTAFQAGQRDLRVTDSYRLVNNSSEDKLIEVIYPFISSITDSAKFTPALTVKDGSLETQLLIGDYTGGFTGAYGGPGNTSLNLDNINSWEGYKALLESGRYFEVAQGEKSFSDQRVTVYTFHSVTYPEEYDAATLEIEFDLPMGSRVITYGMNGASFEDGSLHQRYSYFVRHAEGQRVIILGKTPAEYRIQGYENGGCEKKVDGIKGEVKIETMLLSEVIRDCMTEYRERNSTPGTLSLLVTEELVYRAVVSMFDYTVIGGAPKDRYDWMRLDDLIGESCNMERVMYLTAQVTIPAGQSLELESKFMKDSSHDFACADPEENQGVTGYDMMTKLGSSLEFREQNAGISLPQTYEIIRQNFGFEPEKGITEVSLDMAQERYYLEIRAKK